MDTSAIKAFSKNGNSGSWIITQGREVALTLAGLYYVGHGRVVRVTCWDPILVRIVFLDTSPAIEGTRLPFPERGLELLCDCVGKELIWEAQYLRSYIEMATDSSGDVGGPSIPILPDEKPIDDFLTLKHGMKVALLICDDAGTRCAGLGVIDECSPRGVWCGFLVLHSFFVIVTVTTVNTDYADQIAYCEDSEVHKPGAAINHRIL